MRKICGIVPITHIEKHIIVEYCKENNIKPRNTLLEEFSIDCKFLYNDNKCMIYEVRPLICKNFYCNTDFDKLEPVEMNRTMFLNEIDI